MFGIRNLRDRLENVAEEIEAIRVDAAKQQQAKILRMSKLEIEMQEIDDIVLSLPVTTHKENV
jgi:hypothetical protein